jgi:hypothetical protein
LDGRCQRPKSRESIKPQICIDDENNEKHGKREEESKEENGSD